jgi:uncharacterized protein with GYD domain
MATYVTLVCFTEQGIKNIKESPARLEAAKHAFLAVGAQLKQFYLVTGQYDIVALVEAPDDETMAELALSLYKSSHNPNFVVMRRNICPASCQIDL